MKRLLLPLIAALALPTSVNAESIWLVISKSYTMEKIEMKDMEQCKEMGNFWSKNATGFAQWVCLSGK